MSTMLSWPSESAKRQVCRYGCCVQHQKDGETKSKVHRKRESRAWKKDQT